MGEQRQLQVLRIAAAVSFLLALVNHLLPPKAFAATQLLFDYSSGVRRRGLVGSALDLVFGAHVSVGEIYAVVVLMALFGAGAFYVFLMRTLPGTVPSMLLVILALNSFAFSSFVGNTGYLDTVLLGATLLAISTDGRGRAGLVVRLLVCVLGVFIHENMLPYFTVLIAFDLWLARGGAARSLVVVASPVLVAVVTVAILAAVTRETPEQAATFAAHLQAGAGFRLDPHSTDVAGRSIGQNFALMADLRHTRKYWGWVLFDGVPLGLMSLWLIWLALKVAGQGAGALTRWILVGAVAAPLSLNLIAFDVVRFGVASVLVGFVVIAVLTRYQEGAGERLQATLSWPLFTLLLVVNANIFTIEVNIGAGHSSQFPWVLLTQLKWLGP